jgi:hypothetical protein
MGIKALDKPRNTHCPHCAINEGCTIYGKRPGECGTFFCTWLYVGDIPDHWRPAESGMVLHFDAQAARMEVHVDPARPDAWRDASFHPYLRAWAEASAPTGGQVIVWVGEDLFAVLPDRDKALGALRDGQMIVSHESVRDSERVYDIEIMDADDPRIAGL